MVAYSHNNHARLCGSFDNLWAKQCYLALHLCPFLGYYILVSKNL